MDLKNTIQNDKNWIPMSTCVIPIMESSKTGKTIVFEIQDGVYFQEESETELGVGEPKMYTQYDLFPQESHIQ